MKKIIISLVAILIFKIGFSQNGSPLYPITQNLGSSSSLVDVKGGQRINGAFVLGHFVDTAAANAIPYVKNFANGLITTDTSLVWLRSYDAKKWLLMPTQGRIVNGDSINYLVDVNRPPGQLNVYGKFFNGISPYSRLLYTDSIGSGGGSSYTFPYSVVAPGNAIQLENDTTANPANYFYGRNSAGRRGWYPQSGITGVNIYNSDGTFTGYRTVNGNYNGFEMSNISSLNIGIDDNAGMTGGINIGGDNADNDYHIRTIGSVGESGIYGYRSENKLYSVTAGSDSSFVQTDGENGISIKAFDGSLKIPLLNATTDTTGKSLVIRNLTTGLLENIDPALIGGGGISGLTTNELVYGNSATTIASLPVATYPSLTELSYVKGLTSNAQTQINNRIPYDNSYSWTQLSDSVSLWGVDGAELVYIPEQDSLILLGGWHRDSVPASRKQVYKYNSNMSFSRQLPDAPWTNGLHCFGQHYQNDTIYVWGGDAENPSVQEFWSFKVSTETWALIRSSIVSSRYSYGDAWIDNEAYMIGGLYPSSTDSTNGATEIVKGKPDGTAWSTVQTGLVKFGGTYSGSGAYFNGYLYMIAGVGYATLEANRNYKVSVWRSADKGVTWEQRGDVPFKKLGAYGYGKGFIKLKPNWDGTRLGLFFGYQRVDVIGIVDYGECLYMDQDENWFTLPAIPKTAKYDNTQMNNRHAAAVTATPDGGWIVATGYHQSNPVMNNDAWKVTPIDGKLQQGGNYLGQTIKIGSRDSNMVQIIMQDTAIVVHKRDSTNFYNERINIQEVKQGLTSGSAVMIALRARSSGTAIRFKPAYHLNNDSATFTYQSPSGGYAGGFQMYGVGTGTFNMYKSGRMKWSYAGDNGESTTAPYTFKSASSTGNIISFQQTSGADRFIFDGTGVMTISQAVGTTYFTYATGFKIATASSQPIELQTAGATRLNIHGTTGDISIPSNKLSIGASTAAASSVLDVTSTTKGFLPPRMTGTQQAAISSPATGLMIYNTDSSAFTYYTGSAWVKIGSGGGGSGVTSIGTINSETKSANGAVITGTSLVMQTVDATYPGLMTSALKLKLDSLYDGDVQDSVAYNTITGAGLYDSVYVYVYNFPDYVTYDSTLVALITKVTASSTTTFTNKRWTARVGSTTSSATPTINTDNVDIYKLTAQTVDISNASTNLTGSPNDGDIFEYQITGTATRNITWGTSFVSSTVTLPAATSSTATLTVIFQYYTTSSYGNNKWVCVNSY